MLDALDVDFINNTVINNNSTASAGILFNTVGAPVASTHGNNCTTTATTSCPQPSGLVSIPNSAPLTAGLPTTITCPPGHYAGANANNGSCRQESYPLLANNVLWQNSSYYIGVGPLGTGTQNQQHVVALYNAFTTSQVTSQHETGECVSGLHYWDIGVCGDTGPGNHGGGAALNPQYSDKKLEPSLIDREAGVSLVVPMLEKVGSLRQTPTGKSELGKSYWMAFSNVGRRVKRGDRVDVVIGNFRAQGLAVE